MQGVFSLRAFFTVVLAIAVLVPYGWRGWVASCASPCIILAVALWVSVDSSVVTQSKIVASCENASLIN